MDLALKTAGQTYCLVMLDFKSTSGLPCTTPGTLLDSYRPIVPPRFPDTIPRTHFDSDMPTPCHLEQDFWKLACPKLFYRARYSESCSVVCWIYLVSRNFRLHIYFRLVQHNSKDPVGLRQTNCAILDYKLRRFHSEM